MNKFWIPVIVILAAGNIIMFWPGSLFFLNDDFVHLPLTEEGAFFQMHFVRPMHELLVKVDLALWRKNAYGYHITSLVMHLIVCIQLFNLCRVIQTTWLKQEKQEATNTAFLSVALFLVYPQHAEALAWI